MMRAMMEKQGLTNREQALKVMGLKMWGKELSSDALKAAIRKIDHTLSDRFAQNLFEALKNRDGLVDRSISSRSVSIPSSLPTSWDLTLRPPTSRPRCSSPCIRSSTRIERISSSSGCVKRWTARTTVWSRPVLSSE